VLFFGEIKFIYIIIIIEGKVVTRAVGRVYVDGQHERLGDDVEGDVD